MVQLKQGKNVVAVDITGLTHPVALYVSNNSQQPARVRITGTRLATATNTSAAPTGQQPMAAPVALGGEMGTYPTYIHDSARPEAFAEYLPQLRTQESTGMTDLRFGDQDLSAPASAVAKQFDDIDSSDSAAAAEAATTADATFAERLATMRTFDGYDAAAAWPDPQSYSPHRIVTVVDNDVWAPSPMFAWCGYYHFNARDLSFLRGNTDTMYGWGHSHEFGHMLDNRQVVVKEITNNLYSLTGAYKRFEHRLQDGREGGTLAQVTHPAIPRAQRDIDAWLQEKIEHPTITGQESATKGSFSANTNVFHATANLYPAAAFFNTYDYSDYDFSASPFTEETARDVATYGVYGAALRTARADSGWPSKIHRGGSVNDKYNRYIILTSRGSGFTMCDYFEVRGFDGIADDTRQYCAQFPDLPVKLHFASVADPLKRIQAEVGQNMAPFDANTRADISSSRYDKASGGVKLTFQVSDHQDSVTGYEVYRDGVLIGFTRNQEFLDTAPNGAMDGYSVVAYDFMLNSTAAEATDEASEPSQAPQPSSTSKVSVAPKPSVTATKSASPAPTHQPAPSKEPEPTSKPTTTTTMSTAPARPTSTRPTSARPTSARPTSVRPTSTKPTSAAPQPSTETAATPTKTKVTVTMTSQPKPAPSSTPTTTAAPTPQPAPQPPTIWQKIRYGFERLFVSPSRWSWRW